MSAQWWIPGITVGTFVELEIGLLTNQDEFPQQVVIYMIWIISYTISKTSLPLRRDLCIVGKGSWKEREVGKWAMKLEIMNTDKKTFQVHFNFATSARTFQL